MFKTDERKAAAETAEKVYEKIVTQTYGAIEAPSGPDLTGNWNSENKLIMRTHPTPSPYEQFQDTEFNQPTYANPNATSDSVQVLVPEAPKDLVAQSVSGHASLLWSPPLAAITFNVYRGTASGNETLFATGLTGAGYVDKAVVPGSTYFYTVTGVNSVGESAKSVETSVTI